ncbi:MAG: hypothetical protein AAFP70_16115 [Calditrichota bacterium]
MKKDSKVGAFLIGIGSVTILAGIYQVVSGAPFDEYFFSFFIGITLVGLVWFNDADEETE